MDSDDGLRTSVTEINDLPNEVLVSILSYFYTQTLESTIGQVCIRWKELAEEIMRQRLTAASRRFPETMIELRTQFCGTDADLKALKEWERIYVGPDFFLLNHTQDKDKNAAALDKYAVEFRVSFLPAENELWYYSRRHPFDKTLKFIPCHQLLVVVKDYKCIFYHESVIFTSKPYREYTVKVDDCPDGCLKRGCLLQTSGIYRTLEPVSYLDVYHDKVAVVLKTTNHVKLYQLTQVCHAKRRRKVVLKPLAKIVFPNRIQAITLFKDKVYVLYTTWYFAVWHLNSGSGEAEILTSQRKIAPEPILDVIRIMGCNKLIMYRMNNLLFVKLLYYLGPVRDPLLPSRRMWFMLDMNEEDSVELEVLPAIQFKNDPHFGRQKYFLSGISLSGNNLLLSLVSEERYLLGAGDRLFTQKLLKLEPRKEDFIDATKFHQLFNGFPSSNCVTVSSEDVHIATLPPSLSISTKPTFLFLGISTSLRASPGIQILSIGSGHGLYIA